MPLPAAARSLVDGGPAALSEPAVPWGLGAPRAGPPCLHDTTHTAPDRSTDMGLIKSIFEGIVSAIRGVFEAIVSGIRAIVPGL